MVRRRTTQQIEDVAEHEVPIRPEEGTETASASSQPPRNGESGSTSGAAASTGTDKPVMQRAEELTDRLGERIGYYAGMIGHKLLKLAARAKEEAEDIWAEAQEIRRNRQPS